MAYEDVATLGIRIETNGAGEAVSHLEDLNRTASRIELAVEKAAKALEQFAKRATVASRAFDGASVARGAGQAATATERLGNAAQEMGQRLSAAGRAGSAGMNQINDAMSRMLPSVDGLMGKIAGLAAAYVSLNKAMELTNRGIQFNSDWESAQIGIGTIITGMVKLQDANGRMLEGFEKYKAAQGMAKDLMATIQKLGLETTATSTELVQGTMTVMGPAIMAGFKVKEIPKFAVEAMQAMQTLGIPLEQTRSELDALLTGNVNKAQDQLAPRLFADVPDVGPYIKQLKAAGKLQEELFKRLEPYKVAGQDVANTFKGLASNLEEALEFVSGQVTKGLTEELKQAMRTAQDLFIDTKSGVTGISKDFENIAVVLTRIETSAGKGFLGFIDSIANGVKSLNAYIGEKGADNFIADMGTAANTATAAILGLTMARKAANAEFTVETMGIQRSVTGFGQYTRAIFLNERAKLQSIATSRSLAASTGLVGVAVRGATAAFATSRVMLTGVMASMRAAGASLLAMFGGPLGLAFTAAAAGLAYFMSRETDTERATRTATEATEAYRKAMQDFEKDTKGASKAVSDLTKNEMLYAKQKLESAIRSNNEEIKKQAGQLIQAAKASQYNVSPDLSAGFGLSPDFDMSGVMDKNSEATKKYAEQILHVSEQFQNTEITAQEYANYLGIIRDSAIEAGDAKNELIQVIIEYLGSADSAIVKSADFAAALSDIDSKARGAASGLSQMADAAQRAYAFAAAVQAIRNPTAPAGAEDFMKFSDPYLRNTKYEKQKNREVWEAGKKASLDQYASQLKVLREDRERLTRQNAAEAELAKNAAAIKTIEGRYKATEENTFENATGANKKGKGGGGGGKKKGGTSDAEKLAQNADKYSIALEKMRNEVTALENATNGSMTTYDRMVAKINAEKEAAVKNADVKARDTVNRKQATAAQAEEMASLEKRKAVLDAQQKIDELNLRTLRDKCNWYKEFAELTGDTNQSLALQNQVLDMQAQEWIKLGIPMDLINQRIKLMKQEIATDPLSGFQRGFRKLTAEGTNWAQTTENIFTNTCSMMTEGFANFVTSGKLGMDDLLRSWINMINQMVAQAVMSQIFSMIGKAFSFVGSSAVTGQGMNFSGTGASESASLGLMRHGHAHGDVFTGLHGYANQIVTRPTFFTYGHQLTRFAKGGVMGEAGPEAVMPLTRMGNGNLGVRAEGVGGQNAIQVTLVINDQTEGGITADAQNGELDGRQIAVIVRQVEQNMVSRAMNGKSPYTRYLDKTRGLSNAKQLY